MHTHTHEHMHTCTKFRSNDKTKKRCKTKQCTQKGSEGYLEGDDEITAPNWVETSRYQAEVYIYI